MDCVVASDHNNKKPLWWLISNWTSVYSSELIRHGSDMLELPWPDQHVGGVVVMFTEGLDVKVIRASVYDAVKYEVGLYVLSRLAVSG